MSTPLAHNILKKSHDAYCANVLTLHTEYQPIIKTCTMDIFGYEALARIKKSGDRRCIVSLLDSLSKTPEKIFQLEKNLKQEQIKYRPPKKTLFLNIDPQGLTQENIHSHWLPFCSSQEDIVIEITESKQKEHVDISHYFGKMLTQIDVPFAIDDFFSDHSIFSSKILTASPMVKLDKNFLAEIKKNASYIELLRGVVNFCLSSNKTVVLEGVETLKDLEVAKQCNIPYVQGYLFKKLFLFSQKNMTI